MMGLQATFWCCDILLYMKDGEVHEQGTTKDSQGTQDVPMSAERIRELRERLYARGANPAHLVRHSLQDTRQIHQSMEMPRPTVTEQPPVRPVIQPVTQQAPVPVVQTQNEVVNDMPIVKTTSRRSRFRKKIILFGFAFFLLALVVSSISLFWGNNTISGENISIAASGPIAVGAGEEFNFQVAVTNQNAVSMQSAALIVEYPEGTQSISEENKILTSERIPLESIGPGELVNVPVKARIFGEENEEKEIKVSIEYRISGSNATFDKDATPLRFKVSTSPVVVTFDTLKTVSAGQEFELKLIVQSNSPAPLTNILIKTTYPEGFDFTSAKPDTVSGEDTWKIATLKPSEKQTIIIKGLLSGHNTELRRFGAIAGVASDENRNALASQLANASTEIAIEQPFLDVVMSINGSENETVVLGFEREASVAVKYKNTLDTTIYDGLVKVELAGNALNEFEVNVSGGFYDSGNNTITWDAVDAPILKEILPGKTADLNFTIRPKSSVGRAPELSLKTSVMGKRIFERSVPQELIGTADRTIRIESTAALTSDVSYQNGQFTNTGPIPPVAEKTTQYTYTLTAKTGTNELVGAEVTAVLPTYVRWLDLVSEGDSVTYTASSRTLKWNIGDMNANSEASVAVQVSLVPSLSQVGTIPVLLETQRFKATDRFTNTVVRTEASALTTELPDETDEERRSGRVRAEE